MLPRRWMLPLALAAAAGLAVLHASAQEAIKLGGELFIAGKTPIDPPPKERKNTHAYITVSGPAAVAMYGNMRAKAVKDLCQEGNMIKRAGPLACSLAGNGTDATCDFSIDLGAGRLAAGKPC
jgi:hypothetical protein